MCFLGNSVRIDIHVSSGRMTTIVILKKIKKKSIIKWWDTFFLTGLINVINFSLEVFESINEKNKNKKQASFC